MEDSSQYFTNQDDNSTNGAPDVMSELAEIESSMTNLYAQSPLTDEDKLANMYDKQFNNNIWDKMFAAQKKRKLAESKPDNEDANPDPNIDECTNNDECEPDFSELLHNPQTTAQDLLDKIQKSNPNIKMKEQPSTHFSDIENTSLEKFCIKNSLFIGKIGVDDSDLVEGRLANELCDSFIPPNKDDCCRYSVVLDALRIMKSMKCIRGASNQLININKVYNEFMIKVINRASELAQGGNDMHFANINKLLNEVSGAFEICHGELLLCLSRNPSIECKSYLDFSSNNLFNTGLDKDHPNHSELKIEIYNYINNKGYLKKLLLKKLIAD